MRRAEVFRAWRLLSTLFVGKEFAVGSGLFAAFFVVKSSAGSCGAVASRFGGRSVAFAARRVRAGVFVASGGVGLISTFLVLFMCVAPRLIFLSETSPWHFRERHGERSSRVDFK